MLFALGFIAGIATCAFIAAVLLFFRKPLIQMTSPLVTKIENIGPRAKGFIYVPESEEDEARAEHVRKNAEQGKDTPISELL